MIGESFALEFNITNSDLLRLQGESGFLEIIAEKEVELITEILKQRLETSEVEHLLQNCVLEYGPGKWSGFKLLYFGKLIGSVDKTVVYIPEGITVTLRFTPFTFF